ncbi:MAG: putative lipid II flippase FtsW [Planctomycetota bacterium]|nr:putative lipid II flippase FtsW [Planctomycetaceae bacterium]MDQ3329332.1 putative lipid II flippase FtsW [Planctomycetota bacterium]
MSRDAQLFVCVATVLVAIGAVMAHSASMTSRPTEKDEIHLGHHAMYLGVGLVAAIAAAVMPPHFWRRAAPWLFAGTILLLVAVLVPGLGTTVNGARRWLRFGSFSIQPTEIAKLTLPLMLCKLIVARRDRLGEWIQGTAPILWPAGIVLPLVLLEPDLGTTLFLASGAALLLFLAGWPLRNFVLVAGIAVPALLAIVLVQPYQLRRLTGFVAVWTDPAAAPYQVRQALITLGSGGLHGTGLGQGWQKLSFLPEASTDFVFAVVGEELGLIGTLGLVASWVGVFVLGLRVLKDIEQSSFAFLSGITLLFQLVGQAVVNMAVVTALLPPKGIALPLISYGGSNLVVSLAAIGVILSMSRAAETETL